MNTFSTPPHSQHPHTDSIFRFQMIRRILLLLAIIHFFLLLGYSLPKRLLRTDRHRDVLAYYLVSERIHLGGPVYWPLPEMGPHKAFDMYVYPPVLSSILAILPNVSFVTFARIWTLFLYAAFWIYAMCLTQLAVGRVTGSGTLIAGLALTFFPGTHLALSMGQVDPFLWVLFGLSLVLPAFRGAGLMGITLVKPWAAWPLVWATIDGWRVLVGASIVVIGSIALGVLIRGPTEFYSECLTWFRHILPVLGQGTWKKENLSISFAVLRITKSLGLWEYAGGILPTWARFWLLFSGIVFPLLVGWFTRRRSMIFHLSAIGCAAVLFAPICWVSYLPVLLTFFAVLIGQKFRSLEKLSYT